jgi:hypothetical protein
MLKSVHGSLRQNVNIPAVVIMLLNDIKFVRIPAHVTMMFDTALTTEDASPNLKSIELYSFPNPGDPTMMSG